MQRYKEISKRPLYEMLNATKHKDFATFLLLQDVFPTRFRGQRLDVLPLVALESLAL